MVDPLYNRLSIGFVLPIGRTLGGSNIWSARLCGHLAAVGVETVSFVHTNPGWHPDVDLSIPAASRCVVCGGPPVLRARLEDIEHFASVYAEALPSVIVPNFSDAVYATCALLTSRRPGLRVIGVAHGNAETYYDSLIYYEEIIDAFVGVSEEISCELRKRLPLRQADVYTKSCPVDVSPGWVVPARDPRAPLVLTYAGRLTNYEKRVSQLAPLIAELGRLGVDFTFRIIGEGGYRQTLQQEVARLPTSIRNRVHLEGMLPPEVMPARWRESDVCILVSDSEGTSLSMLEAMAEGCVPVVTRVSGTAAVIRDGINGFVVERGDLTGMARRIRDLADDRGRLRVMSLAAHERVLRDYAYGEYVPWFMGLLERIQRNPARTWPSGKPLLKPLPVQRGWLGRFRDYLGRGKR